MCLQTEESKHNVVLGPTLKLRHMTPMVVPGMTAAAICQRCRFDACIRLNVYLDTGQGEDGAAAGDANGCTADAAAQVGGAQTPLGHQAQVAQRVGR